MNNDYWQDMLRFFLLHKGKVIGTLIGFLIGILVLFLGFFKTIIILLFTLIGYYLGSRWDIEGNLKILLNRILPKQFK